MIVLPRSRKSHKVLIRRSLSRWWRPILGSSSTYSAPTRPEPSCDASLMRCASPPESVLARRSSVKYSIPTFFIKSKRSMISRSAGQAISCCFFVSFSLPMKSIASWTVIDVKPTILVPRSVLPSPPKYTRMASGRRRAPLQSGHSSLWKIPTTPSPLHSGQAP